jgi:DNA-directed RNA polymerase
VERAGATTESVDALSGIDGEGVQATIVSPIPPLAVDLHALDAELEEVDEVEPDEARSGGSAGVGLSPADLADLADHSVPEEKFGNQKFVKFVDVLPPAPPRGAFNVDRVKESAYFFS